ncbi:MAG: gas vesicle protein [bacterium]|nr:gas vesicle protein [bacterium]
MQEQRQITHGIQTTNLADILERVLDKGIVIAGDIRIQLADVQLLDIKIRLLIASVDKAKEIGIDWWEHDVYLSSKAKTKALEGEKARLEKRVRLLEGQLGSKSRAK